MKKDDHESLKDDLSTPSFSKSFDDIEIERERKLGSSAIPSLSKSKDDLWIIEQEKREKLQSVKTNEVKIAEEFLKSLEQSNPKPSIIDRIKLAWQWIKDTKLYKAVDWILNTKPLKVLLGKAVGRAIAIGGVILTLAGVFPAAGLTAAIVTLCSLTVIVATELYEVRSLRKLAKENDLLMQNRRDLSKQQYLLALNPNLKDVLQDQLLTVDTQEKNYHYVNYKSEAAVTAANFLANNCREIGGLATNIITAISRNPMHIVKAGKDAASSAISLITAGVDAKHSVDSITALKIHINHEKSKDDVSGYSTFKQLRIRVQEQHIQTAALTKLIQNKGYFKLTDEQKCSKFVAYKKAITELTFNKDYISLTNEQKQALFSTLADEFEANPSKQAHEIKEKTQDLTRTQRALKTIRSLLKDLARDHNPFYEPPQIVQYSPLSKAMENIHKKSTAEIVPPAVKAQLQKSQSMPALHQKDQEFSQTRKLSKPRSAHNLALNK